MRQQSNTKKDNKDKSETTKQHDKKDKKETQVIQQSNTIKRQKTKVRQQSHMTHIMGPIRGSKDKKQKDKSETTK